MFNKYLRILAIVMATVFIAAGCSLVSITKSGVDEPKPEAASAKSVEADAPAEEALSDDEYTDDTVVAEYDGGKILRKQAMDEFDEVVSYYESYGYELDDEATVDAIKSDILDYLCENEIVMAKAKELGLTTVTDEERKELEKQAQAEYDEVVEFYKMYFEGETEEETRQQVIDYLNEQDYSLEIAIESLVENAWHDKLVDYVCKDLTVSEDDIRAQYDELVAADQENYSEDSYSFEYAAMTGETISWYPEGYRSVKHILIPFTDDQMTALSDKQMQLEDVNYYIEELDWEQANPADEEVPADEEAPEGEADLILESDGEADDGHNHDDELVAEPEPEGIEDEEFDESELDGLDFEETSEYDGMTREQLEAEKTKLEGELKALQDEYYATIADTVKSVQDKIAAGEDFESLISQYGSDEGMTVEPGLSMGYLIAEGSEMFETAFTEAALALQNVGDVSEPVIGTNGCHIIKYMSDVTPGAVPYEQLHDTVSENALTSAREDMYNEAVAEWVAAANVVTYPERMN